MYSIGTIVAIIILIILIIALVVTNIRIVPQANAYVLERLGAYYTTWQVGLHFKIPLVDKDCLLKLLIKRSQF